MQLIDSADFEREDHMKTALRADDGAKLYGSVVSTPNGYRASCYAVLRQGSSDLVEAPDHHFCHSRVEGVDWIERKAAARGFTGWHDISDV